ncbi:hypothetical protein BS78_09G262200 [Paspalum vaginatum]|nr:hypothetical protein BS78_09G262200 [Paspalum vaginatum]
MLTALSLCSWHCFDLSICHPSSSYQCCLPTIIRCCLPYRLPFHQPASRAFGLLLDLFEVCFQKLRSVLLICVVGHCLGSFFPLFSFIMHMMEGAQPTDILLICTKKQLLCVDLKFEFFGIRPYKYLSTQCSQLNLSICFFF